MLQKSTVSIGECGTLETEKRLYKTRIFWQFGTV